MLPQLYRLVNGSPHILKIILADIGMLLQVIVLNLHLSVVDVDLKRGWINFSLVVEAGVLVEEP